MSKYLLILLLFFGIKSFSQDKIPFVDYESISALVSENGSNGEYEEAIKNINKINKNDSTYCSSLTTKSYYYILLEKYDDAIAVSNEGLRFDCESQSKLFLLINKGVSYANKKDYNGAINAYDEALKTFPKNPKLWYNKGIAYQNSGDYPNAVAAYQKAILYNPIYRNAHLQLGNICYEQQLMSQALMCYNMALLVEPDSERAFSLLKYVNDLVQKKNENEPDPNFEISEDDGIFEDIDLVLNNQIALNEDYEVNNKINIAIVKQNHALMEQLKEVDYSKGFWSNFYLPFYKWILEKDKFDEFTYTLNQSIKNETYKKIIDANESEIKAFISDFVAEWYLIFENNAIGEVYYEYYKGKMQSEGPKKNDLAFGDWKFYDTNGRLKSKGTLNDKSERDKKWVWYHDNDSISEIANYKNGNLNGEYLSFYRNGRPNVISSYKDGKNHGEYKYHLITGGLKQRKTFKDGELQGTYLAFFDVGKSLKEFEAEYDKGILNGEYTEYYANGDVYSVLEFENNELNGKETQYFWNKEISLEASYKDNKLNGPYLSYHSNGKPKEIGQSVDGYFEGNWKLYYEDGTLNANFSYSKGNLQDLYTTYDTDGKLYSEFQYRKGEIISYKFYDKSGSIIVDKRKKGGEFFYEGYHPNAIKAAEGRYDISGGKIGNWKFFNTYGVLSEEGTYNQDSPVGVHKGYYDTGALETLMDYDSENNRSYYEYYHKNGQLRTQGWYKNNLRHGVWKYYYIDGTIEAINFFHKDQQHGTQQSFKVNGKLDYESKYEYGILNEMTYYDVNQEPYRTINYIPNEEPYTALTKYENGNKQSETAYVNNMRHGEFVHYNIYGDIDIKGQYVNNEQHGEWTWYYDNGNVLEIENYRNGNKHGVSKHFYESGELENEHTYEFGLQVGKWLSYFKNGVLSISTEYKNNQLHGRKEFYDQSGNLQLVRFYDYGNIIGYSYSGTDGVEIDMIPIKNGTAKIEAKYENGNPSRVFEYINGDGQGDYKTYFSNGKLENHTIYEEGEIHNLELSYYENGNLKSKENAFHGYREGVSEKYYENGNLKSSINFKNGVRHGEAKFFDESGELLRTEFYDNGTVYATE